MEQQVNALRQGEATQAQVEAERVQAGAQGKHALVQQLAEDNADLSGSFAERGEALERTRKREQVFAEQAGRLEVALKDVARKVNILGMNAAVGHALREQQVAVAA